MESTFGSQPNSLLVILLDHVSYAMYNVHNGPTKVWTDSMDRQFDIFSQQFVVECISESDTNIARIYRATRDVTFGPLCI
jgi:hypothetical protein